MKKVENKDLIFVYNPKQIKYMINECGCKIYYLAKGKYDDICCSFLKDDFNRQAFEKAKEMFKNK